MYMLLGVKLWYIMLIIYFPIYIHNILLIIFLSFDTDYR